MLVPIRIEIINLRFSRPSKLLKKSFNFIFVNKQRKIIDPNNLISVVKIGLRSLSNKTKRDRRAAITAQNTDSNEYIYLSNELLLITSLKSLSRR